MKKVTLIVLFSILLPIAALAVKAYPGVIEKSLPDGSSLSIRLIGDEHFSYTTTVDGYLIALNEMGYYEYANMDAIGNYLKSGVRARNISIRTATELRLLATLTPASDQVRQLIKQPEMMRARAEQTLGGIQKYPLQGSPRSLVLLVNFTDVTFNSPSTAQERFTNLLNQPGYSVNGATGSARDYFTISSFGQFTPIFDVYGPYDLPNSMAAYGAETAGRHDTDPYSMVRHACAAAMAAGVNFADYDADGDGFVDNVFVYYAGYNQAEGGDANSIWPHRSILVPSMPVGDNIFVLNYACSSELKNPWLGTRMCNIGTFCHEFGHILGLPDWYATDYGEMYNETPGMWSVMDQGNYNNNGATPPSYSAYERFYLGWTTPEQLTPDIYTLEPLITTNKCYLVAIGEHNLRGKNPDPRQFIMLENRQYLDWDKDGIPEKGMLITRINYSSATWAANTPNNIRATQGYEVLRESGNWSGTYPGMNNKTSVKLSYRDGTDLKQPLQEIKEEGSDISFVFAGGGAAFPNINIDREPTEFKTPAYSCSEVQTLEFFGHKLSTAINFEFASGRDFEMRLVSDDPDSTTQFVNGFSIMPDSIDSTFYAKVEVRFVPSKISYNNSINDVLTVFNMETVLSVDLTGVAPRPIYVVAPTAYEGEDVTPYSFKASWSEVEDAQGYYLTVYKVEKGVAGGFSEAFSNFDKEVPPGWSSTFKSVTRSVMGSSPQSAFFQTSQDSICSEQYLLPINKISFWVQGYNTVGTFTVEGYNGETWQVIDIISVSSTLRAQVKEYPLSVSDNYIQFRMSFEHTSGSGGLAFDDFTVYTDDKMEYQVRNSFYTSTQAELNRLSPNKDYYFRVRATDKDEFGRYENITNFSNAIKIETLDGADNSDQSMQISMSASGDAYVLYLEHYSPTLRINIYGMDGKLLKGIVPTSNSVELPQLPSGIFYILRVIDTHVGTTRKDKYCKFFYAL